MCLILHKPAGLSIDAALLEAALRLNRDGWGAMGFDTRGELILERQASVDSKALVAFERRHRDAEYVLHLRRRTRGGAGLQNVHPFRIVPGLYLMHNGTLPLDPAPGRSDSAELAQAILRPLARRYSALPTEPAFLRLLALVLKPENKLALLQERTRKILLVNREHGAELDGLWLSSTRWIDRARLPLVKPPQPQMRAPAAEALRYL